MPLQLTTRFVLPLHRLAAGVAIGLTPFLSYAAPTVEFNTRFLQGAMAEQVDLARFEQDQSQPGVYSADIAVNGTIVGRREIELRAVAGGEVAICLSPDILALLGVDAARLPRSGEALPALDGTDGETGQALLAFPDALTCEALGRFIPQASAHFDVNAQRLDVSIPQAWLARDPRGWVNPELWDDGINAATLAYSLNHQRISGQGPTRQSTSALLVSGLNLGAWRFRHDGYLANGTGERLHYRAGRSYVQRNVGAWGMQLTAGDASTGGDVFDGLSYRGVSLATDPRMLPDSVRDYAPVVRGVAQTNAKVVIRQRGNVLYQSTVAAGPFEINDLYGTAYAGDLDVEVLENDGRVQRFVVPYAAVPELLRAGQKRISATAGILRGNELRTSPIFGEATLRVGLGNRLTAFGGITATEGYQALVLGNAVSTGFGALSGDVTVARTRLPPGGGAVAGQLQGQAYRLAYSKNYVAQGTNITVAAYRFSTGGYLSLADAVRLRQQGRSGGDAQGTGRQRSRLDLTLDQRVGQNNGALYASGSSTAYWNDGPEQLDLSLGYSGMVGRASYSIALQRSLERYPAERVARRGNSVNLAISMPLGARATAPRASTAFNRRSNGRDAVRAGVTGLFGAQGQGSYNAAISHGGGQGSSHDAGLSYRTTAATVNAGYSHSAGAHGLSLGASGGIVLHGDGLALTAQLGETIALVQVPDAEGAVVNGLAGAKVDGKGYAVVPFMTPYRRNEVTVDPKGLSLDVELETASATTVPTAGAVVRVLMPTSSGRSALIEARQADGTPLPFGVDVYNAGGQVVGVVGQASRLWVRGIDAQGELTVRWGSGAAQQCVIAYDLGTAAESDMLVSRCLSEMGGRSAMAGNATVSPQPPTVH